MQIRCRTLFDITQTGTTGHFKSSQVPYSDRVGNKITDLPAWNRSRNQQRNFETLLQIVGMRTQLVEISTPELINGLWYFEVEPDRSEVFQDEFRGLHDDCSGVPMILGLDEQPETANMLQPSGTDANIWFKINI